VFGYVKINAPSMRVREHELYRALYCGLCRSMGKHTGQLSRFTLNYDLAFLAAVRILATGESISVSRGRCMAHPLKKRAYVTDCTALAYAAEVSAVLTEGKLADDAIDEGAVKRTLARLLTPAVGAMVKKAKKHGAESVSYATSLTEEKLKLLTALERENCTSLDRTAEVFGELTGELFAAGLTGAPERICRELGRAVGRFIYVCDAADDAIDDLKKHRYNPILALYGTSAAVIKGNETFLSEKVAESLLTSALLDLERAATAVELLCDGAESRDTAEIVRNIIYIGMPETLKSVLRRRTGKDEKNQIPNGETDE